MTDLFSVAGKTVLITGGSRGIGATAARGYVEAGAHAIVSSRNADACERTADALSALGRCTAAPADVSTPDGVRALVEAVDRVAEGKLDILLNNAGVTWGAPLEDFPRKGWDKVLATNLTAVFQLTVAMLPALRRSASAANPARVISVGLVDGLRVSPFDNFSYGASKAGVHLLTRHLASTLADEHVLVNAIAPGAFRSDMTAFALDDEAAHAEIVAGIPLSRVGAADDIVGALLYLSSPASAYVTGTVLPVDGGVSGCA
ncbi:SDR family oxidoreductase [Aeromicrobium chenweiae]|uniref:3-oxoacyl-ACP reductase n=1 Tax=Aeromicrobium chenweiae TaxID=2079793 RepID=A0A2S0WLI9_9ACTN|nr:SDR family oxidoreductase [Aeromicrobium chenweiae]AWB92203.1 3-oxoacyl-ACP reductase [Aeromicrobium chenweiae]TGN31512.1 SDR family oxidoreductase [Aeromicrobium chenweiae]